MPVSTSLASWTEPRSLSSFAACLLGRLQTLHGEYLALLLVHSFLTLVLFGIATQLARFLCLVTIFSVGGYKHPLSKAATPLSSSTVACVEALLS